MQKNNQHQNSATNQSAHRLLIAEHQNLVHWLHDDLGQNLVAIKSFTEAIIEQDKDTADDTTELANLIKQTANVAFRATYDLMQELRAQDTADQAISAALTNCLEDARLKENEIQYQLNVDTDLNDLDYFTKAVILRSVRTFINFSRQVQTPPRLSISLGHAGPQKKPFALELRLVHQGELDILPGQAPSLEAMEKRIDAIGGVMALETNNRNYLNLNLLLNPLPVDSETTK